MSWFDGTFWWQKENLMHEFPKKLTNDFMMNGSSEMRIAIINNFTEGTDLFAIADPHAEYKKDMHRFVFYHAFFDKDADKVKKAMKRFRQSDNYNKSQSVSLFRKEEDGFRLYAFGYICTDLMDNQDELKRLLPTDIAYDRFFVLPLRRYFEKCPVCGHRKLKYRGEYEICTECGWEDEGGDVDDSYEDPVSSWFFFGSGPNRCNMESYRVLYLRLREEHPDCSWYEIKRLIKSNLPVKYEDISLCSYLKQAVKSYMGGYEFVTERDHFKGTYVEYVFDRVCGTFDFDKSKSKPLFDYINDLYHNPEKADFDEFEIKFKQTNEDFIKNIDDFLKERMKYL